MGRLNEYDFYPIRIWERYDDLISKEEVKNILMEIYDEMFGFDCNLNQNNLNGFDFINVFTISVATIYIRFNTILYVHLFDFMQSAFDFML